MLPPNDRKEKDRLHAYLSNDLVQAAGQVRP